MEQMTMTKPFTLSREKAIEAGVITPVKPFTYDADKAKTKTYLILLVFVNADAEDDKDWEIFKGTTQEFYDHVKLIITSDERIDVMQSFAYVESPRLTLGSKSYTLFNVLRGLRERGKVSDDSSFDIDDYYYDTGESENVQEG